jgi:phosphoribosyl 1,2-cyclic phosphate phosphodiesterase
MNLDITFLGTGTSQGVPVIGCPCSVCQSLDLCAANASRTSVLVSLGDFHAAIDSGPDFRAAGVGREPGMENPRRRFN